MDILAEIFLQAGLKTRLMHHRAFAAASGLIFPCSKSMGFHVVTRGRAYLQCAGQATLVLGSGDVAFMSRGRPHVISTEPETPLQLWTMADEPAPAIHAALSIVSGAYQCWNEPIHPFFAELPDWFVMRADEIGSFDEVQLAIKLLTDEVRAPGLGSDTVTKALLDIIFMHIIRKLVSLRGSAATASWSGAMQQQQIKAALELMHSNCAHDWRLDELARQVGLSRAGFAQKFKAALGATPLQYLTTVRVQQAMALLTGTPDKLETIASAVGYGDAFSFSKVFKKLVGESPREFRLRDQAEKHEAYRFT